FELTGHKWFCTHPIFDVFFTLAQTEAGITCFVAQRPHPSFRLQRLKDKLGGRCLASSEVEYDHLPARVLGEEGRGTAIIVEQLIWTRLDTLTAVAGMMRRVVAEAIWHARHRSAFGAPLARQPAMVNVLADLAIESEAATVSALRIARAGAGSGHGIPGRVRAGRGRGPTVRRARGSRTRGARRRRRRAVGRAMERAARGRGSRTRAAGQPVAAPRAARGVRCVLRCAS